MENQKWKAIHPRTKKPRANAIFRASAIKALSSKEYAATTRARKATKAGKQVSRQPKKIAKKVRRHRRVS